MPQRRPSISSDVHSTSGLSVVGAIPTAQPPPAYIGAGGAAQLITAEVGENVVVTPSALTLVNNFLDQILFDILTSAHSTNLVQLRSAVPLVLKPRLGKAALQVADDELREYLEDSDDEDHALTPVSRKDFDLDWAWKLARLRCMVYTRLGDLEEEDEEEILEQEGLIQPQSASQLGPASAIFLTSVLEYIGEQALYYAAQHAQKRLGFGAAQQSRHETEDSYPNGHAQLVIEDADMSQIGRESPLSRLWRSWRRATRHPKEASSRPLSPETPASPNELSPTVGGMGNIATPIPTITEEQGLREVPEEKSPSQIPIPMSDRDVDEIEVPGLAREIRDADDPAPPASEAETIRQRPTSMLVMPSDTTMPLTPASAGSPPDSHERALQRPAFKHTRSNSLPTPAQTPYASPSNAQPPENKLDHEPDLDDGSRRDQSPEDDAMTHSPSPTPHDVGDGAKANRRKEDVDDDLPATDEHPPPANRSLNDPDEQQVGRVAAAVSAVAGVFGLAGASAYVKHASEPANPAEGEIKGHPLKNAAEGMLDSSSDVSRPRDTVNEVATTRVGESNKTQIPNKNNAPRMSTPSPQVSDPEDLALSSEDERPHGSESKYRVARSSPGEHHDEDSEENEQYVTTKSTESSPSTRKPPSDYATRAIHRQGVVYETSQVPHVQDRVAQPAHTSTYPETFAHASEPRTYRAGSPSTALPNLTAGAAEKNSIGPTAPQTEENAHQPLRAVKPRIDHSAQTATYLGPSNARPGSAHAHVNSKSSQHTERSRSSSSSSKLLGFDREQQTRLAHGSPQEAAAAAAADKAPSSPVSRKPNHLQLQMSPSEEGRKASVADLDDEAKKKSLEMLINSDETLHYTLTPSSARAEQFPVPPMPKTQAQEMADLFKTTKSQGEDASRPRTARSLVQNGLNGLRANPPIGEPTAQPRKLIPSSKNIIPPTSATLKKSALGMPREARVEKDNTRDLADYARSTGPDSLSQLPKALATPPPRSAGAASSKSAKSSASRSKYQARDAVLPRHAESTELIDFIREGPPRPAGEHRIDRNVAPFRRTMDSDDLNDLTSPQERDQNGTSSVASTQNGSVARSLQSSLNSRTALLDSSHLSSAGGAKAIQSPAGPTLRQTALAGESFTSKRTQRRVRDPYAIDTDSDEEFEETIPTPKPRTQEESLIDFLRNTAPPPSMTTQPILAAGSSAVPSSTVKPESSNPGLRERLLQNSLAGLARKASTSNRSSREAEHPPAYNRSTNAARTESPHLTQVGSKLDTYRPTKPTHADHVDRNRQKDRVEARDPRSAGNTSDLADYLRNSGPLAPPPPTREVGGESVKEEGGFMKFFMRRRGIKT